MPLCITRRALFLFMDLQEKFNEHIRKYPVVHPTQKQLIAVSGGVDSVVLCDLMCNASYEFTIAHCNFQLRGAESERDEAFVRGLGQKYGKEVLVKKFDTDHYASHHKVSIQVAARQLRYDWFYSLINTNKALYQNDENNCSRELPHSRKGVGEDSDLPKYILTAHHANDNIETVIMNFFKGTGIAGLHGILPLHGKIFRPLLFAHKDDLLNYANQHSLSFVEDTSNLVDKYTRNFFRNQIIPLIKEVYPNVEKNLIRNIERLTEAEELYKQSIELHKKKLLEFKGNEVHIPLLKLQKTVPLATVIYEIIKDYGFTSAQVSEVTDLLSSETGKYISTVDYRIIKNRKWLIISPARSTEASNILIEANDKKIKFELGELTFETFKKVDSLLITSGNDTAMVDLSEVTFPLILRRWKPGDYFYPLGMQKKKKLNRFLTDQKLSKTQKENIWVLEMNKKIIWIVGHRIDNRFKINNSTKLVLKITSKLH